MNKEDNFKEKFKQALISTVKVISDDYRPNIDKKNASSKNLNFFEFDNLNNRHDFIRLRAETDSEALKKTLEHLEIINKDLISIFKKNNIEPIDSINKKLDPNFHQAMLEVENDQKEPGTIIQEIQKGFMMKDRLLRPALVAVAKKFEKNKNDAKKDKKNEQNQEKSIKK